MQKPKKPVLNEFLGFLQNDIFLKNSASHFVTLEIL